MNPGQSSVIFELLQIELEATAFRLKFVPPSDRGLDLPLLKRALSELDYLSMHATDDSRKLIIAISSLLWTYGNETWPGIKNYLFLFLSRVGLAPSSIILDKDYNFSDNSFGALDSLINECAISLHHIRHEVTLGERTYLLSEFQKNVWFEIEANRVTGISAPTSAGKSFIIGLKAIDLILKERGCIIYVVPTLSLVSQVAIDFKKLSVDFGLDIIVETTFNIQTANVKTIYVLTQEKAISAFSQSPVPFPHLRLLVIDEIQNVERVADWDDQRAKVLYDVMIELSQTAKIDHIVISGPRINAIDKLGQDIFGLESQKISTESSPVINLTYSLEKKGGCYHLKLYTELLDEPLIIKIANDSSVSGYGQTSYTNEYLTFLSGIVKSLGINETNVVFSPTTATARKIAIRLAKESPNFDSKFLNGLSQFIEATVHPLFSLCKTVKNGVVYHHAKLPQHIRLIVEHCIRDRRINNIVCTTTLLQGVNLPVQNIVIRNPNLFVNRSHGEPRLTNYEIANLRGRAGRLLKDFVGRAFILDESSFNKDTSSGSGGFLNPEGKSLTVGYGAKYKQYRTAINTDLIEGNGRSKDNREYSYLTTYIRQSILKHGEKAIEHLSLVGIDLDEPGYWEVEKQLKTLSVSAEICNANRYWDPYDLDILARDIAKLDIPSSLSQSNIANRLNNVLEYFQANLPLYYEQYFAVEDTADKRLLLAKCILAERWLREIPLKDILSDSFYDSSERIEDAINFLQNKISYGLPMLIKPLYDMINEGKMFPRFIEMGAYRSATRHLIEANIPRETAIYLVNHLNLAEAPTSELLGLIKRRKETLSYWYKIQIDELL